MHNYKVYSEDEGLSSLSVETGAFESGSKKLLQIAIYHGTEGVKVWRAKLERQLFFKELSLNDLIIENSDYDDFIHVTEKKELKSNFPYRAYFYQDIGKPLDFERYAGLCSPLTEVREGQGCSMTMKIEDMRVRVAFDKSQIEQVEKFKQMAKDIVADYLPKHAEKFN